MKYEGRYWKKSFSTQEIQGPYGFNIKADSTEEALKRAIELMVRLGTSLSASVVEKSELLVEGQWREFGPKGFM